MVTGEDVLREKIEALRGLAEAPDAHRDALLAYLEDPHGYVVAKAAEIVGEAGWDDCESELVDAYARLEVDPVKRDPGCKAKASIADALNRLGSQEAELFRRAARHRQLEPSWGPPIDTAVPLRINGAAGLARLSDRDFLFEAATLLNDAEPNARIGIVEVIDYFGGDGAELLLRMKVLAGDAEPEVLAECFAGLMRVSPDRSLDLVAGALGSDDDYLVESAALAIAESRSEAGFLALKRHYEANRFEASAAAMLLPISLTRHEAAFEFLLELIAEGPPAIAHESLTALEIHASNDSLVRSVAQAVAARGEPDLSAVFRSRFPTERA